ncbi:ABC transporter permease [Paenibacillus jilunlii]|uniref:Carbohydrate ABC transporter membrane protein 1, CUT1 family n=1 Tax=Paenibacillus jilunlii TaxID=682956 RepID=A0A1G9US26_9BACL|nr:ABC transporter permease subunit [Paenibacillus jilunlii]KWX72279.1 protein lplB [Paenibacillus jilunlii]SDM62684.1 carbohydrate ABC transporter membrane protein 1, CUT1 family [Paenibacillus jilunlii]
MKTIRKHGELLALFLFAFAFFIVFKYGPLYGVVIAFKDFKVVDGIWGSPWVGFQHFQELFQSSDFYRLLKNTLLLNFYQLLFAFPAPIILAILLNEVRSRYFQRFIQTTMYLPHFVSWVIMSGLLIYFLSPTTGIMADIMGWFGKEPIFFMGKKEYFRSIVVGSSILKDLGWGSIIYFAALSGINPEIQESAIIDGANRWQRIIRINIPSIMPTVSIMFILSLGGFLSANFEQIINLLNPVTFETGDVIDTYVYRVGLQQFQYSYTAAIGLFKSLVGLVLILGANLTVKKLSKGENGLW